MEVWVTLLSANTTTSYNELWIEIQFCQDEWRLSFFWHCNLTYQLRSHLCSLQPHPMQQPCMLFLHVIYFFVIIILVLQPFVPSALVSPLSPSFLPLFSSFYYQNWCKEGFGWCSSTAVAGQEWVTTGNPHTSSAPPGDWLCMIMSGFCVITGELLHLEVALNIGYVW